MNFLLNNRLLVIVITIVLTSIMAIGIVNLKIDSSITAVLPEDNPDFKYSQLISTEFTSSEEVIISILTKPLDISETKYLETVSKLPTDQKEILKNPDTLENEPQWSLYSIKNLELISEVTAKVLSLDKVVKNGVTSLVTIANQYNPDQTASFKEGIDEGTLKFVKRTIETNPMARGRIINKYHDNTLVIAPIPNDLSYSDKELNQFLGNLETELNLIFKKYPNARYELTGQPKVKADITKYIRNDIAFLLPIAILIVMIIIFFFTRSFRGTLIPLIITILSVVWTFGLKGILGWMGLSVGALTLTESVLPVVLISVACADGIHITNQSLYFVDRGVPGKAAVYDAMQLVRLPVILAAVTTAVGFGSLIFSPGRSLKNMGIFLAFGVIIAMAFSLFLIPVLISYFKPKRFSQRRTNNANSNKFSFSKYMRPFTANVLRFRWLIMGITVTLIIISIPASLKVKTDQDEVRFFKKDAEVRKATENIEKNLGGISTMYLVMENASKDLIIPREKYQKRVSKWTPDDRKEIYRSLPILRSQTLIQEKAEQSKAVSYTTSYASYFQLLNYLKPVLNIDNFDLKRSKYDFRKSLQSFEQQSMIDEIVTEKFVTPSGNKLNTHIRLQDANTSSMQKVVDSVNQFIFKLYQLDPSQLDDITKLGNIANHRTIEQRLKAQQYISEMQQARKLSKKYGFKTVQSFYKWLQSLDGNYSIWNKSPYQNNFYSKKYSPQLNIINWKYFGNLEQNIQDPDFRMIADHFSYKDTLVLITTPLKFRWAGDYIRIVNGSIIVASQIISLAVATIIILILLTIIFRSPLTGVLLSIPVIIAIFLNFTIMWIFKVSLNPATSIVASVGMGVGIDYAIHYFSRFRKLVQMTGDYNKSLIEAAVQSSSGIILNAIAVGVGFLVLVLSKYTIIQQMGLIVAFSMLTSAFGALTILPAMLYIFRPTKLTKLSSLSAN